MSVLGLTLAYVIQGWNIITYFITELLYIKEHVRHIYYSGRGSSQSPESRAYVYVAQLLPMLFLADAIEIPGLGVWEQTVTELWKCKDKGLKLKLNGIS